MPRQYATLLAVINCIGREALFREAIDQELRQPVRSPLPIEELRKAVHSSLLTCLAPVFSKTHPLRASGQNQMLSENASQINWGSLMGIWHRVWDRCFYYLFHHIYFICLIGGSLGDLFDVFAEFLVPKIESKKGFIKPFL